MGCEKAPKQPFLLFWKVAGPHMYKVQIIWPRTSMPEPRYEVQYGCSLCGAREVKFYDEEQMVERGLRRPRFRTFYKDPADAYEIMI